MGRGGKKTKPMSAASAKSVGLKTREHRNEKGVLHRLDGPARIGPNGEEEWYKDGKRHRESGPAKYWTDGEFEIQHYYKNGILHREDGPAVNSSGPHPVGKKIEIRYFLFGEELDYKEWQEWLERKDSLKKDFVEKIKHQRNLPKENSSDINAPKGKKSLYKRMDDFFYKKQGMPRKN